MKVCENSHFQTKSKTWTQEQYIIQEGCKYFPLFGAKVSSVNDGNNDNDNDNDNENANENDNDDDNDNDNENGQWWKQYE